MLQFLTMRSGTFIGVNSRSMYRQRIPKLLPQSLCGKETFQSEVNVKLSGFSDDLRKSELTKICAEVFSH